MKKTSFTPLIFILLIVVAGTFILVNVPFIFIKNPRDTTLHNYFEKFESQSFHLFNFGIDNEATIKRFNDDEYTPNLYIKLDIVRNELAKGDYSEAEDELRNLLVFYPKNRTILSYLGGVLYLLGKYDQAIVVYNNLSSLYPADSSAITNLGLQYEKKKNYKMAVKEFRKSLELSKDSAMCYLHLAGLYSLLGDKKEAIANFQKAHRLLGKKIVAFSYDPVFDNIRNMPEFVLIVYKDSE